MAEAKQYITHAQTGGNVLISEDVVSTIVENTLTEVEGVVKGGAEVVGKKSWGKGVRIHIAEDNTLTIGSISLDLNGRNAYRSGELADLTAKEFDVIEFLMRNPNRVYSREALLDTIWAYEYRSDIRTVDVHIRRLREKLEENPAQPKYIMTKWGVGYYFKK